MATTLYLIRHGETEGSSEKRYKGSIDVPLSEKGMKQIKAAAAFISGAVNSGILSAVYCSPLSRAVKSAEIIAEPHGLKPIIINNLKERNFGVWEGMTFTEIKEKYPAEFEAWANNPVKYSPVGGESTIEVRDRVISALTGILDNHKDENIGLVAHGGVNRIMLCHLLGIPLDNIFRVEQDFAAVNIIDFYERYPVVKLLNYNGHL
jgi:alpha-ribazole phosphatase/probable phosphoglycerate mutase